MKDPHVYQPKSPKTYFRPNRRQLFWTVTIVALIGLAIAGYVVIYTKMQYDDAAVKIQHALSQADRDVTAGDYQAAKSQMTAVENLDARKADKVLVYAMLANIALAQSNAGDVAKYYGLKHQLDPESAQQDAFDLAKFYQRAGQKDKARRQYEIAIRYLESQPSKLQRNMDLSAAKARLEELKAEE